jgi:hypothetical protein
MPAMSQCPLTLPKIITKRNRYLLRKGKERKELPARVSPGFPAAAKCLLPPALTQPEIIPGGRTFQQYICILDTLFLQKQDFANVGDVRYVI